MTPKEAIARRLYDHWRFSSNSFEAARQPDFDDAADNLRRVFEGQAAALSPVVTAISNASYEIGYDDGLREAEKGPA